MKTLKGQCLGIKNKQWKYLTLILWDFMDFRYQKFHKLIYLTNAYCMYPIY